MNLIHSRTLILFLSLLFAAGCGDEKHETHEGETDDTSPVEEPSNRVDVPATVRSNLGITFAAAEYRPVAQTIPLPGHFEVLPSAQHHYPAPAAGRVTVLVSPLDRVVEGQLLLEIEAPDWRSLQLELVDAQAARLTGAAKVAQAKAEMRAAGSFGGLDGDTPNVFTVEIDAANASVAAAEDRLDQLIAKASTLTGLSHQALSTETDGKPHWRHLSRIPIRATAGGVVREVDSSTGTWVGEGTEVVHVVDPEKLRFRARALQADLIDHIRDGQTATIVPPEGKGAERRIAGVKGTIRIGVTGDPDSRTTDVFIDFEQRPEWARPLVVAVAEVVVAGNLEPLELAIPSRAVIRDGLDLVFFRRDPSNADVVIRTIADLGPSDGRYTTVLSGLGPGNEVVVDGIYPLKLATTGQKVTTGHVHPDGTFHEGDDH